MIVVLLKEVWPDKHVLERFFLPVRYNRWLIKDFFEPRLNKGYESTASTLVIVECQLEDLA